MFQWLDERLDIARLSNKFLRKAFPVHHSFFLGEITLFAFITLLITGIFLTFNFEASSRLVDANGQMVPAAYASILYIDSLPVGAVIRSAHHWSAHIMIAAAFLHLIRILLSGAYKKPREVNWFVGLGLIGLAIVTAFTGYALPNDAFAEAATKVGYNIALAVPWIGEWIAQVVFGGSFPTERSIPRLTMIHALWLPLLLLGLIGVHLLVMIKQKHTQPAYAEEVAPGKILGVPLMPHQALMMGAIFLIYMGLVFVLAGLMPAHPVEAFGPPSPTADVDPTPDWYFFWIYGILKMIPNSWEFTLWGGVFGPQFWGGVLIPGLLGGVAALLPFLDTRKTKMRYVELPSHHPWRTGSVIGLLVFFIVATMAGYMEGLNLSISLLWTLLIGGPILATVVTYAIMTALYRAPVSSEEKSVGTD